MALGKFYGVGLGTGDPKLLTLKAIEVLEKVDVVFAPISKEGRRSIALETVKSLIEDKEVITLLFPMHKDTDILQPHWESAGREIGKKLQKGRDVAFITIGDPTFYSTYTCVMRIIEKEYPDVEIHTIPGVPSLMACFAELNLPMVDREDKLAVLPAEHGLERLEEIAKIFDTIVLMKVSRSFKEIAGKLEGLGLGDKAIVVTKCGTQEFFSSPLNEVEKVDFLSMIILKAEK
jgi:precorrin-2/cobalt-factor-2 C20-methyltransferase